MKRVVTCAVLAILGLAAAGAQDPSQQFVGEATVNVVEVPVRVIDPATGKAVTGLDPSDFRILENGVQQQISNFSEVQGAVALRTSGPAEAPTAPEAPTETAKPLEIVYFLDLYLMYRGDRDRAIEGLETQYRDLVPDGESVSLVVFDGELETIVDRSRERREILEGIQDVAYIEAQGIRHRISFTQALSDAPVTNQRDTGYYERSQRNREFIFELERRSRQVGNAVLATMARYARADGRRVLVALTPGYPRTEWAPTYYAVDYLNAEVEYPTADLWRRIANEAADLGFTLYTVDTSGLSSTFPSDVGFRTTDSIVQPTDRTLAQGSSQGPGSIITQDPSGPPSDTASLELNDTARNLGQWLERARKDLLITAATSTGGDALFSGDVASAVDSIRGELDQYYSIGYVAEHSGDGKIHDIEVELPEYPSYRLVHRTAYVDQPAATRAAQALRSEMLFGADANPLGVRVEIGEPDSQFRLGAAGSKRIRIPFEVKIPYARLAMIPRGDLYWGKVLITFFGEDGSGNQSELASFEQPITVESGRYEEAVAKGYFRYSTTIEVEGGQQRVFVGIQDTLDGRTSIIPQEFGN
jgi:VWFA-related protein